MRRSSGVVALVIGVLTATIPTFLLFQAVTFLFVVPLALGLLCILLGVIALRTEGRFRPHAGWIAFVIMLIAVALPFEMIAYHDRSGSPIVLVIPNGYRGPVKLIIDREQGKDVPLSDGRYTYQIPEGGTLVIKDDSPFRRWHSMSATYANGKTIPIDDEDSLPPDAVTLHSLGSGVTTQNGKKEEFIEDFVGTKAELRRYVDRQ
jgi:hypothetical protein